MAIEPISSITAFQAQPVQKTVVAIEKTVAETTDGSAQNGAQNIDIKTAAVPNAEGKSNGQGSDAKDQQNSSELIRKAVEQLNKKSGNSEILFGIHDGTNRVTIKIVDKETKEIIKELPPEKTLDMIAKAWELAGILIDERR